MVPPSLGDKAQKVCTLMPMSVRHNADGHRAYHKNYKKPIRDEARADCQYGSAVRPVPSAHGAAEPRPECAEPCTLMPMSVCRNADGHRDYH
jgi:hypothetical protein